MSLSNNANTNAPNLTGKVVIGMDSPGPDQMTIQELEGKRQLLWDDATNNEYLDRVKRKAMEAAKEIKMLAELEAEALRATARHDGYAEGVAQAQEDINSHIQDISTQGEALLAKIGAYGTTIFEDRREDILNLIRLAVEKTLKVEIDEKRMASLESLMSEALDRIESQRQLTIKCHPEDVTGLEEYLRAIQDRNPSLQYWTVRGDASIESGGVVIEGAGGKVDNTIDTRWESVEPILDQLAVQITVDNNKG
ncbi:flagellar assembly protein FliH [Pseudodesulfovibrio nedwellii]|uniref:Flagellar assembly protein FliH n=1 Tax=Pseudodesulfovibrio nedwellii TaxID=2973072 RepID=A0ABM8AZE2_9BACT|nr:MULTISPECIES: FliH/SctL family protein [Pseudodesulfovibrio]BDQ36894.1 flagellar assembly protein FliH [Pseudodesulfovibrio nedwellii]